MDTTIGEKNVHSSRLEMVSRRFVMDELRSVNDCFTRQVVDDGQNELLGVFIK